MNNIKKEQEIYLDSEIINSIHDYTSNVLKFALNEIFKIISDTAILRLIPLIDSIQFEKICKSSFDDEDFIKSLLALNAIFKSDDLESLETCELYHNILKKFNNKKFKKTLESLNIIKEIRKILFHDYEDIIIELENKIIPQ